MNIATTFLQRKYALPDKAVASQILMYRQLLHTECKPGLRLSRDYQGTVAQKKVMHMPWWEAGVESSKRMVISYDNLIVRLWLNGAIMPYADGGYAADHSHNTVPKDEEDDEKDDSKSTTSTTTTTSGNVESNPSTGDNHVDTLIDEKGLPPVPHPYWVDRLGFQQTDPVTDFRSGGVLSLAMLLHIVESCPNVHARFLPSGDSHMLPFGITCINVTDMIAKFCMFSKNVDRMDVLMSQKPFWKMFEDPNSLLVMQELCMEMLCNVVVELGRERKLPKGDKKDNGFTGQDSQEVTVFDFAEILERTEKRVHDDLLGGGPRSVDELRGIFSRISAKYNRNIEKKEKAAMKHNQRLSEMQEDIRFDRFSLLSSDPVKATMAMTETVIDSSKVMSQNVKGLSESVMESTKSISGNVLDSTKAVTGNVVHTAGGVMSKFKDDFGFLSPKSKTPSPSETDQRRSDDVDFAMPPQHNQAGTPENELENASQEYTSIINENIASNTQNSEDIVKVEKNDLQEIYDFLDEQPDAAEAAGFFTIDDEDLDM